MADDHNPYAPPPASPMPPPPPQGGSGARLPWEDRQTLGFAMALVETVKLVVTDPKQAFGRLRMDGDYVGPLIFGLLIAWATAVIQQMWSVALGSLFTFGDAEALAFMAGTSLLQVFVILVIYPVIHLIVVFLWAGVHHLALMILGGLHQSKLGFEGTFKVLSYAMVAQLGNIVPFVGPFITYGLFVFLLFMGFQAVHRSTPGQSILAVLLPTLLCCACFIALFVTFGAAIFAAIAGGAAGAVGLVLP